MPATTLDTTHSNNVLEFQKKAFKQAKKLIENYTRKGTSRNLSEDTKMPTPIQWDPPEDEEWLPRIHCDDAPRERSFCLKYILTNAFKQMSVPIDLNEAPCKVSCDPSDCDSEDPDFHTLSQIEDELNKKKLGLRIAGRRLFGPPVPLGR